ncbi:MAG: extracellular solute-binding protein [Solirubrobacterales bacterium]|nr:extracellular solute-binding protein [Solirubrobacterales bacterium]
MPGRERGTRLASGRRRIVIIALLVAIALTVAGAGCGGDDDAGQGTDLTWFVAIQPGGSIQEIAKRCSEQSNGEYSIDLQLLPTTASDQRDQLVRRLGAEDSSVDLLGMDVIWTAEFANAGWLREFPADLREQVTKDVFDSVIETASFDGKLYGAPFNSNTQLLFYRTDEVERPPKTWGQMISEAERLGMSIQVQANRYEGYTVLVNSLIESAGAQILSDPDTIALEQGPTEEALATIGRLANSSAAAADISTSTEDTARLGFEAGGSAFMINYPFAYGSAKENAPEVFKNLGIAEFPRVVPDLPSKPPLGGFNIGVGAFTEHPEQAFDAAACIGSPQSQLTATELDGLPPTRQDLYTSKVVRDAYPGFAKLIERSIDRAAPRPLTPAYTDLSLAIQSALHPPDSIDPDDPQAAYDDLREKLDQAVKREGLL